MKNKYFYIVIGVEKDGRQDYQYKRVTSADNLSDKDYKSVNIFGTQKEALRIARFWNYCAIQNNNSLEEQVFKEKAHYHKNSDTFIRIEIGFDIKAYFDLKEISKRFFDFYEYDTINAENPDEQITDFLYEITRDNGIQEIMESYKCFEGLEFDFDAYNRTHNDYIYTILLEELSPIISKQLKGVA